MSIQGTPSPRKPEVVSAASATPDQEVRGAALVARLDALVAQAQGASAE